MSDYIVRAIAADTCVCGGYNRDSRDSKEGS